MTNSADLRPIYPRGTQYVKEWKTLRWYFVLISPLLVSTVWSYVTAANLWVSAAILIFGLMTAFALFVEIVSGVSSSKSCEMYGLFLDGTFGRDRNPIVFWIQIALTAGLYLFVIMLGFVFAQWIAEFSSALQAQRLTS